MKQENVIIIGAGPCGLSAAIYLQNVGIEPLIIEKGNVVEAIYRYPTHQTFFSTSERLEIGDVPFMTEERKPRRNQALVYYRDVVKRKALRVHSYEKVERVTRQGDGSFIVETAKERYSATFVIMATGYYDNPNLMGVAGEDLPHVAHYFKEAHPHFNQDVVVIGGKNSAVDAALELQKAGARVTVLYRGDEYSPSIKPWILPEFDGLVRNGEITLQFAAFVTEITPTVVRYEQRGIEYEVKADVVFAMTGYKPDHAMLQAIGIAIDRETGRPQFQPETMETNVNNVFVAGVIAAGNNANEIFIENGKFHGEAIATTIAERIMQRV